MHEVGGKLCKVRGAAATIMLCGIKPTATAPEILQLAVDKHYASDTRLRLRKLLDLKCCLVSGEFKGVLSGNAPPPKPARLLAKIGHCGHRKTCEMTGNQ